jgi:hypothetical protein
VPYGTDSRLDAFQPRKLSGLATIIESLRDNKRSVGVHIFEATSNQMFEDEDDDEDEDDCDRALVTPTTACMPEHHPRRGQRDRSPSRSRKLSRDNA